MAIAFHTEEEKLVEHINRILRNLSIDITESSKILDFGCGTGKLVYEFRRHGFSCFGVDIVDSYKESVKLDPGQGLLPTGEVIFSLVESNKGYHLPFEDNSFDFVLSSEVFEHVQDYECVFGEIQRILKPGCYSLHFFPPRYAPLEVHTNIPLGGIFKGLKYLLFWARLGIRNEHQKGLDARTAAAANFQWLGNHTNYLSKQEIKQHALRFYVEVDFIEKLYMKVSPGRPGQFYFATRLFPFLPWLYGNVRKRALLTKKA